MKLRETIENAHITYMENITVKCGDKILYDDKILYLINSDLPLLNMTTKDETMIIGKGYQVEVAE